jgi:hypothetical protein
MISVWLKLNNGKQHASHQVGHIRRRRRSHFDVYKGIF